MNELDYDAMQKKRTARGARHRKGGSKSKRCTLPHDNLTDAQRAAMNGPVEVWNMNAPMDYGTFTSAPLDIQQSYIDAVQRRFGVGITRISTDLFGLSHSALWVYTKRVGLKGSTDTKPQYMTGERRAIWEEWLSGREDKPENGQKDASEGASKEKKDDVQQAEGLAAQSIAVEWVGEFDPAEFMRLLARLPVPAGTVRIRLEIGGTT